MELDQIDYEFKYHPCRRDRIIDILSVRTKVAVFCNHTLAPTLKPEQVHIEARENDNGVVDLFPEQRGYIKMIVLETGRIDGERAEVYVLEQKRKRFLEIKIGDYQFRLQKCTYAEETLRKKRKRN